MYLINWMLPTNEDGLAFVFLATTLEKAVEISRKFGIPENCIEFKEVK